MKRLITICCVGIWVLLIGSVLAGDNTKPNPNESVSAGRSVSDFMTPDGRFDLNAVRASGYQGPLDLKGVDVRVDPRGGVPMVSASSPQSPADDPDDQYWDNSISPSIPGLNGTVNAMTVYDGKLIVAGSFSIAGDLTVNNIAAWDGTSWSALGGGTNDRVYALTVFDNKLIAGGSFTIAGGVTAKGIAAWDGSGWSPLGTGMEGVYPWVCALTAYDNKLIAGGSFTMAGDAAANYIAAWDGTSWSPLGEGINSAVYALTVYDYKLIAGGVFTSAGGTSANGIASFDGRNWSAVGTGVRGWDEYRTPVINAMTVWNGSLIVGGSFGEAGGASTNNIASWNGADWSAVGLGIGEVSSSVTALTTYNNDIVAGVVADVRLFHATAVHAWNGNNWSTLASGYITDFGSCGDFDVYAMALTVFDDRLITGGVFPNIDKAFAHSIAAWDGVSWEPIEEGVGGNVRDLVAYGGKLIATTVFSMPECTEVSNVKVWDGVGWSLLGGKVAGYALAIYDGKLVVGGGFDTAGGEVAHSIATWDGSSWSSLGSGTDGSVSELTVYKGKLVAGGVFDTAGGVAAHNIATWDGSSWSPLGMGVNDPVRAQAEYDNQLIVGGSTWTAGGWTSHIAAWNGTAWLPLGSEINGVLNALTVYDGNLIVGGDFTTVNGMTANNIVSWDGSSWSPLGAGLESEWGLATLALTVYDGKLIAGGNFTTAGGTSANYIASWDGLAWSPLGSGMNWFGEVHALTVYDGNLIAGGDFITAGSKVAAYLAAWTKHDPTDVNEHNGTDLPKAFSLVQNYPNPFNPSTVIEYSVPTRARVTIEIFNLLGQHVRTLVDEMKSAGNYKAEWNGIDVTGRVVSTGVYLYRFKAGDFVETKKMLLLK